MKITAIDIARIAAAHFGIPTTDILSIMKVPTSPAALRDGFAGSAMRGWLTTFPTDMGSEDVNVESVAKFSYKMADAMMKAREL